MDFNSLKDQVSQLTLYDLKAGVRKVQNAVMNYTDMEAKQLNEIMPLIYRRFTEKSAEEWRQIYKALQLLEFLIKNGSERVIDDARSHLTLLKMLRQFHYIDPNGKDQGINVRNRAKELAELLSDVDRIRAERKKARSTRNKYGGVEGGSSNLGMSGGSRYGGFGSETSFGGYSGGVYGDGGGFGGESQEYTSSSSRADRFEEYDEFDDGAAAAPPRATPSRSTRAESKKPEPVAKKAPEVDLFSFDEPAPAAPAAPATASAASALAADDDDFDDFQSAAPAPAPAAAPAHSTFALPSLMPSTSQPPLAAPQPVSAPKAANLADMVGMSSISQTSTPVANYSAFSPPVVAQPPQPTGYQGSQPNYFTSVSVAQQPAAAGSQASAAVTSPSKPSGGSGGGGGGDAFGSLWSTASAGIKKTNTPTAGPALGQLAKEKASAGIWGTSATSSTAAPPPTQAPGPQYGGGLGDLLG